MLLPSRKCQHSSFPYGNPQKRRASSREGWTCTFRRSAASSSFSSTPQSGPCFRTNSSPSQKPGAEAILSRSVESGGSRRRLRPAPGKAPAPAASTVDAIHSSGKWSSTGALSPRRARMLRPPRYTRQAPAWSNITGSFVKSTFFKNDCNDHIMRKTQIQSCKYSQINHLKIIKT